MWMLMKVWIFLFFIFFKKRSILDSKNSMRDKMSFVRFSFLLFCRFKLKNIFVSFFLAKCSFVELLYSKKKKDIYFFIVEHKLVEDLLRFHSWDHLIL